MTPQHLFALFKPADFALCGLLRTFAPMKRYMLLLGLLLLCPLYAASANVLRTAKENIKKRQHLEQTARELVAEAQKEGMKHDRQIECYQLAAECSKLINEAENVRVYLKQPYDTVKFFNTVRNVFLYIEKADSVSCTPNEKGVIKRNNPERYRSLLLPLRANLLKGGMWFYKKVQLQTAYDYFDLYIRMAKSTIFINDNFVTTDPELPTAAYLAVFIAQMNRNYDGVIEHASMAKREGEHAPLIQEFYARAFETCGDTARWVAALEDGFHTYPQRHYFFSRLMDYYTMTRQEEKGLAFCEAAIQGADSVPLYWYGKGLMLLRLNRDREAIDACDASLKLDPNYVNAHYTKGIASLNLAVIYAEQACTDVTDPRCKRDMEIVRSLYELARRPMETVRRLVPADSRRWAAPLYRIYLHLNMEREFEEMERILQESRQ